MAQWGNFEVVDGENAFSDCTNLDVTAADAPDLSGVTSLNSLFRGCPSLAGGAGFNLWDVSSVISMRIMFFQSSFNQDIGGWDVSSVTDMSYMLRELSTTNYDSLLIGWAAQAVQPNLSFGADNSTYSSAAADARDTLTSAPNNWTIVDGGQAP